MSEAALTGFLANGRRIKETKRGVADVEDKVQEVHVLVNSQLQAVAARVTQLISVLEHAGVPVPPNRNGEGS